MDEDKIREILEIYYAMPPFVSELPETKKLDFIVHHLYYLKREGEDAHDILRWTIERTLDKYSVPNTTFCHDPRLLEVYLLKAEIEKRPKAALRELYGSGQFRRVAEFYIVWALIYAKEENSIRVMEIYNLGCKHGALPTDLFVKCMWQIAKVIFGSQLARLHGFSTGKPIPQCVIDEMKMEKRSADPTIMKRCILNPTPPPTVEPETSAVSPPPPRQPLLTYNCIRLLRNVEVMMPRGGFENRRLLLFLNEYSRSEPSECRFLPQLPQPTSDPSDGVQSEMRTSSILSAEKQTQMQPPLTSDASARVSSKTITTACASTQTDNDEVANRNTASSASASDTISTDAGASGATITEPQLQSQNISSRSHNQSEQSVPLMEDVSAPSSTSSAGSDTVSEPAPKKKRITNFPGSQTTSGTSTPSEATKVSDKKGSINQ